MVSLFGQKYPGVSLFSNSEEQVKKITKTSGVVPSVAPPISQSSLLMNPASLKIYTGFHPDVCV